MALGLGQNWKRVRCVVHVGQVNPSSICQMIGRCGRGENNPGLGIMFVENNQRSGKNEISDFKTPLKQSDDNQMDAFALTPVCLCIAMSLDNLLGYIPLDNADPNVKLEKLREEEKNFTECLCSNCDPKSGKLLLEAFKHLTVESFGPNVTSRELLIDVLVPPKAPKVSTSWLIVKAKTGTKPLVEELKQFAKFLVNKFSRFHQGQIETDHAEFDPEEHFGIFEAQRVVVGFRSGFSKEQLEDLSGGEALDGQTANLLKNINNYIKTVRYMDSLNELELEAQKAEEAKQQEISAKNQATLERPQQKTEATKRKNAKQVEERKLQKKLVAWQSEWIQP
ncbi:hypothetical protein PTTG_25784 [Puccinia triticina 1-1 BBBD Race 1]|uniref:Helicase C-terminal domain-containing protein n=1 Tax=Puccinia triticina (isolate 1-1 / race 1 (BBBD)) TaxID=630390 RepID=A0A180H0C3_PUCT1|nr:hypothetical protein PTTG_25784 [Puccinia triticina 1-1 BBBD Race 1]